MLQLRNIKSNHRGASRRIGVLALFGLLTSIGIGMAQPTPTHALTCDENSMVSCIDITFGDIVGSTDLKAPSDTSTSHGVDKAYFYLPVSLTIARANDYSIKVYSENGGELRSSSGDVIPTLTGEAGKGTSLKDLGKAGSVWGYRFNLGDAASDPSKNYLKVPSINDPEANIVSNEQITDTSGNISKVLTLGFATAIDGNLPAGSYSDKIMVAVTATPKQTSAFGLISTMQEMTPEICAAATTPRVDAELSDATGIHHGDNRYVPEAILTDTRDGKEYLVRKLADGNCWMAQNLSLNLSTGKTLAGADTDLNSKSEWTPGNSTQTITGVDWGENDDIVHSVSINPDQYWAGGFGDGGFSPTGNPELGGAVGYAQRGNYYNWFAATAGSGKSTDTNKTTEAGAIVGTYRIKDGTVQDSICPKGWTLPVGGVTNVGSTDGSVKSFYNLVQVYTGKTGKFAGDVNTLYVYPMNFVPAGVYNFGNGSQGTPGERQLYYSGTVGIDALFAQSLTFGSGAVSPGIYNDAKGYGFSIRCVAR